MKKGLLIVAVLFLALGQAMAQSASGCGSSGWPSSIPAGSTRTFTVPSLSGATVRWVVTGNLQIVSGQGANTVTIKGTSSGSGTVYVTRWKDGVSACADKRSVSITTGTPCPSPTSSCIYINTEACETAYANLSVGCQTNVSSVQWYYSLGGINDQYLGTTTGGNHFIYTGFPPGNWDNYYIVFKAVINYNNGCASKTISNSFLLDCPSSPTPIKNRAEEGQIFPNPISNGGDLTLEVDAESVEVVDAQGNVVEGVTMIGNKVSINGARPGLHLVRIRQKNGVIITRQLIIQ